MFNVCHLYSLVFLKDSEGVPPRGPPEKLVGKHLCFLKCFEGFGRGAASRSWPGFKGLGQG